MHFSVGSGYWTGKVGQMGFLERSRRGGLEGFDVRFVLFV